MFSVMFIAGRVIDGGKRTRWRRCGASRGLLFTSQLVQELKMCQVYSNKMQCDLTLDIIKECLLLKYHLLLYFVFTER